MNHQITPRKHSLIDTKRIQPPGHGYTFPSVAVFMPFDPKMVKKDKIYSSVFRILKEVNRQLKLKYPGEMSDLVIRKLKSIFGDLNFNTHRKSVAIFVSPVFEKVYYLNFELEEKIIVNKSLRISDLIDSKKPARRFHVLLLAKESARLFLSDSRITVRFSIDEFVEKIRSLERSKLFADSRVLTEKFEISPVQFHKHIDQSLKMVLSYDPSPVIVIGTEGMTEQYKNITDNRESVIGYIPGEFETYTRENLFTELQASALIRKKTKERYLLRQLKRAAANDLLISGIREVRQEALKRGGKLLLLEKKYFDDISDSTFFDGIYQKYNRYSNIKNMTDEIVEKVLETGGDVEWVNGGFLKKSAPVALVKNR